MSGNINTSFVERVNLLAPPARAGVTIRQGVSKLTRRTWGPAQFTSELEDHLYWWLAYYHFVRPHESLRIRLSEPIARKRDGCGDHQSTMVSDGVDQLSATMKAVRVKKRKGSSSHLAWWLHRLHPDSRRRRDSKQKSAPQSAFQLPTTDCGCTQLSIILFISN